MGMLLVVLLIVHVFQEGGIDHAEDMKRVVVLAVQMLFYPDTGVIYVIHHYVPLALEQVIFVHLVRMENLF